MSAPNIAARALNLPVQTQTLVLATSGRLEFSTLYANPGGLGGIVLLLGLIENGYRRGVGADE